MGLITLRCGLAAGLSTEQLALVTGGQLERLLRGASPAPAGPAPGARVHASRPSDARVAAFLTAAGGALLGGGDPREMLELALLAIEPTDGSKPAEGDLIHELLKGVDWAQPVAMRDALVLALTLSVTPGVGAVTEAGPAFRGGGSRNRDRIVIRN